VYTLPITWFRANPYVQVHNEFIRTKSLKESGYKAVEWQKPDGEWIAYPHDDSAKLVLDSEATHSYSGQRSTFKATAVKVDIHVKTKSVKPQIFGRV
jgi:hypothetical protein